VPVSRKLLIVDDHVDLAENLAEIFADSGYAVDIATSAEAALDKLRSSSYGGLITDFRLPGRSGVELVRELRRARIPVPVVMVSAFADSAVVAEAEEAGALEVLPKPLDFRRLFNLVEEFVRERRAILVIEDDADLGENLVEALKESGIEHVIYGGSAECALSLRELPRLALLDVVLPDQNGVEVARRLLARDPNLRVVFMTGYAEKAREALGQVLPELAAQESRVLTKPVDLESLIVLIGEAMSS
jgi:DNA-binding response OmpR family regulator